MYSTCVVARATSPWPSSAAGMQRFSAATSRIPCSLAPCRNRPAKQESACRREAAARLRPPRPPAAPPPLAWGAPATTPKQTHCSYHFRMQALIWLPLRSASATSPTISAASAKSTVCCGPAGKWESSNSPSHTALSSAHYSAFISPVFCRAWGEPFPATLRPIPTCRVL